MRGCWCWDSLLSFRLRQAQGASRFLYPPTQVRSSWLVAMAYYRNPMFAAEPYEESQGKDSPQTATSPDVLKAFYEDMEKREVLERKLSKRKSNSSGSILWSRKSLKRTATAPPVPPPRLQPPSLATDLRTEDHRADEEEREEETLEDQKEKPDWLPPMNSPRSIIPESLKDLPAWYNKDAWAAVPLPSSKTRYNIHNPIGPRFYRNFHLIPPSQLRPAVRPPSVFSPLFPPMASASLQERSEDLTRLAGPSRTPSNSPLPTPSSSQTRVADGAKPRSRKTSQTAHDNVDLLDVTDPWGTNWHHHSPYDIGLGNGPVSVDVQDGPNNRSRRSSLTTQSRQKIITPSPLSQSTSAVHLQTLDTTSIHMPRKLSKRRTPALGNIFGGPTKEPGRNTVSMPATPIDHITSSQSTEALHGPGVSQRTSTVPAPSLASVGTAKKDKRGSVLGRLVKKFSILRKSQPEQGKLSKKEEDWHDVSTEAGKSLGISPSFTMMGRQADLGKAQPDPVKRVPPPPLDLPPAVKTSSDRDPPEPDRASSISLETPFSMGRLTIANPDAPHLDSITPVQNEALLLSEKASLDCDFDESLRRIARYSDVRSLDTTTSAPQESTDALPTRLSTNLPPQIPYPEIQTPVKELQNAQSSSFSLAVPSHRTTVRESRRQSRSEKTKASSPTLSSQSGHSGSDAQSPVRPVSKASIPSPQIPGPSPGAPNRKHSSDGHKPSPSMTSPPVPSKLPFPAADMPHSSGNFIPSPVPSYNDTPLSTISMLANPPTPHNVDISISIPSDPSVAPISSHDAQRQSRELSPGGQTASRQTETFKLIRSASGNVYASGETIRASGQQWEVVESLEKGKKLSSRSKDRESSSRKEQKRQEKGDAGVERHRARSQRNERQHSAEMAPDFRTVPRAANADHRHPSIADAMSLQPNESKSSRKRQDDRRSDPKSGDVGSHVSVTNISKPQSAPPPPTSAPATRPMERHRTVSARPTSELPSTADMNALRAKEAWEMERLWKARSMYGTEPNGVAAASAFIQQASSTKIDAEGAKSQDGIHGSSHTSFVVQTPFQSQPSHIYHSMPTAPPPIIYSTTPSMPPMSHRSSAGSSSNNHRSFPPSSNFAEPRPIAFRANPLPEPPRASTYEPAATSSSPLDLSSGHSTEHWTKYPGVTAAH